VFATLTLQGRLRSWSEREKIEQAAWFPKGVLHVENHIGVIVEGSFSHCCSDESKSNKNL
jgi:hypothetical protein